MLTPKIKSVSLKNRKKTNPDFKSILKENKQRTDELITLLDISIGFYTAKTFEDIGKTIFENLKKFKRGVIISGKLSIYEFEIDLYRMVYHTDFENEGFKKRALEENSSRSLKEVEAFSRACLEKGKTLLIKDSHSEYAKKIDAGVTERPAHSMVFIPLYMENVLIGLLSFARSPKNSIDEEFVKFLESIGKYSGLAIEKLLAEKKKYENDIELKKRERFLKALSEIQQILLLSDLDDQRYNQILEILGRASESTRTYIFEKFVNEKNVVIANQISEWSSENFQDSKKVGKVLNLPFSEFYSSWHQAFESGKYIAGNIKDFEADDKKIIIEDDVLSFLLVPIQSIDSYHGFIGFEDVRNKNRFGQSEVNLLQTIASSISSAIERERNRYAFLKSEKDYRVLFDQMLDGFALFEVIIDEMGKSVDCLILEVNPAFEKMLGLKAAKVIGKRIKEVFPNADPYWLEAFCETALKGIPTNFERYVATMDKYFEVTVFSHQKGQCAAIIQEISDRVKKDISLKESEARYKKLLESITDYIYTVRIENGRAGSTTHGPGCEAVTGYKPEEFLSNPYLWYIMVFHEDRNVVLSQAEKALTGDFSQPLEHRIVHKNGNIVWIRNTLVPHYNSSNHLVSYDGIIQNITEHKEWELKIQKERDRTQSYLDVFGAMLIAMDTMGHITLINKRGCQLLGYEEHEILGKNWFDTFLPENIKNDVQNIFFKMISGEIEPFEYHQNSIITKSGEEKIIEFHNAILKDSSNKIISVLSSGEDITSRKKAEEERDRLFNFSIDMLCIASFDGYFTQINPAWSKTLGWSIDELLSRPWIDFVHPDDMQSTIETVKDLKQGKEVISFVNRYICKNGSYRWLSWNSFPLVEKRVIFGVVRDITDQKNSELDRMRLQNLESLGVLAGGIAHDFNNILGTISGRVSLAISALKDENTKNILSGVDRAINRATGLTNQLLTFARGGKPIKKFVSIRQLIQDTAKFALSGTNVDVIFNFNESYSAEVDPGQIGQVIQNLVMNANQAMPLGGEIEISTENLIKSENMLFIKIRIKDTGVGISPEYITKIFDPYFTTKQTGSGLGLSVCYSIIKKHDGVIEVESIPAVGTIFTILLPAVENKSVNGAKKEKLISRKCNVLIMDDDDEIRDILSQMLKMLGHSVTETREGNETLKIYRTALSKQKGFDIVFMDLTIKGGMGGRETIKFLRKIHPSAKVVVSSGYADSSIADFKEEGFDAKLNKPYTIQELNEVIFEMMKLS